MIEPAAIPVPGAPTYRKAARRILPFLMLLYFVNYLDRTNISFAKLQFMGDLGLDDAQFGLATGLFFLTYSLLEVPSNLRAARIGIRHTLLRIMVAWGLVTMAQALVRDAGGFYLLRLLLGAAEAGFFPCVLLYVSLWFPDACRGRVVSLLMTSVPLSTVVGAPISGWIMQHLDEAGGLTGWQWLFLLEGAPAVTLGIAAFLRLEEAPAQARWLSAGEKARIEEDLRADRAVAGAGDGPSFAQTLADPLLYAVAFVNLAVNGGANAVSSWTPTLLRSAGIGDLFTTGFVTAGISCVSAAAMWLVGRSSDRALERRWHFALSATAGAAGFLLLPLAQGNLPASVAALTLAGVGCLCSLAIYWTIPTSHLRGRGAGGGVAFVSMVGAFGSGLSPIIVGQLRVQTGSLHAGLAVVAGILVAAAVVALVALPAPRTSSARALARDA